MRETEVEEQPQCKCGQRDQQEVRCRLAEQAPERRQTRIAARCIHEANIAGAGCKLSAVSCRLKAAEAVLLSLDFSGYSTAKIFLARRVYPVAVVFLHSDQLGRIRPVVDYGQLELPQSSICSSPCRQLRLIDPQDAAIQADILRSRPQALAPVALRARLQRDHRHAAGRAVRILGCARLVGSRVSRCPRSRGLITR